MGAFLLVLILAPEIGAKERESVDRIAAVVSDQIITQSELGQATATRKKTLEIKREKVPFDEQLKHDTLQRLIDDVLFEKALDEAKIEVSDEDLMRTIQNILKENQITLVQLKAELSSKGIAYEEYKQQMNRELRKGKFINQVISPQVKISDQDLRDYYQRNQEKFRASQEAHIAEIILPFEPGMTETDFIRLRDTALDLSRRAKGDRGAFAELAKQYSKGPNAADGGDLGMVNLGDIPQEVSAVVRRMDVGEVSNPILTPNAVVVARLVALPELSAKDFDRLRDNNYNALYTERIEEALNNYLLQQRQKTYIDIR